MALTYFPRPPQRERERTRAFAREGRGLAGKLAVDWDDGVQGTAAISRPVVLQEIRILQVQDHSVHPMCAISTILEVKIELLILHVVVSAKQNRKKGKKKSKLGSQNTLRATMFTVNFEKGQLGQAG